MCGQDDGMDRDESPSGKPVSRRSLAFAAALLAGVFSFAGAAIPGGPLPGPLPLFPPDNWWNTDITSAPVDANSAAMIGFVGRTRGLHPDFGAEESPGSVNIYGFPYAVVDGSQPRKTVEFDYSGESDGVGVPFYPIPDEAATHPHWVEGGPPGNVDLRRTSDRHMLIVERENRLLYELYNVYYDGSTWHAGSGAFFDLKTNNRRPNGWTSADAAGLAILPGLVRYDEVYGTEEIRHAFRVTVRATNGTYVFPATHRTANPSSPAAPPMGARLRLKDGFDVSSFSAPVQKILRAMKRYGLIVADNGSDMYVSGTYDTRWVNGQFNDEFRRVTAGDFEVVKAGYQPPAAAYFPHVVVGGGYSTAITLSNTGSTQMTGNLQLFESTGSPMYTTLTPNGAPFALSLAPAASRVITAEAPAEALIATAGWGRFDCVGGLVGGVAVFSRLKAGRLLASAGVLSSALLSSAVLPVDNNESGERFTGLAVANPGEESVSILLRLRGEDGAEILDFRPAALNPLPPRQQTATFVHQWFESARTIRGSLLLKADGTGRFVATALVQERGQLTAVALAPGP